MRNCLDKITLSSTHLLSLINDILDMSKISGKIELHMERFDLGQLLRALTTVIMCRRSAVRLITIFSFTGDRGISDRDSLRLNQYPDNLLSMH